jgi:hypothetical protein
MAKTLKQFKQGYTPRSADEKKFVDKHTVNKVEDANGNKDDVFQATNVKMFDREIEHGYNPGSDEEVYEEVDQIEEKKLTKAEMKKREEVARAIERENPNMPMAKKMAIATATAKKVAEAKDVPFEPNVKKSDAHGPTSRAKHLAKMAMKKMMDKAVEDAATAGSKKKVNETELKNYLLSLYADQLSEEDSIALQEMLETEDGTKIAFMVSMLVEDEAMLDEALKRSEKYSHRSFLNKLKQNNTGA